MCHCHARLKDHLKKGNHENGEHVWILPWGYGICMGCASFFCLVVRHGETISKFSILECHYLCLSCGCSHMFCVLNIGEPIPLELFFPFVHFLAWLTWLTYPFSQLTPFIHTAVIPCFSISTWNILFLLFFQFVHVILQLLVREQSVKHTIIFCSPYLNVFHNSP